MRIHLLQQFFGHSDPAMKEALHDVPLYCKFARLDAGITRLPDESTILRFRHLLEQHQLAPQILATVNARLMARGLMFKSGTVVDATLIATPSSTKNKDGQRDPEMHQTKKKSKQWHFGMKEHIGVNADSGLVHTVTTTAANVYDITQAHALLHRQEEIVFADSGYRGVEKRDEVQELRPDYLLAHCHDAGKRKPLDKGRALETLVDQFETVKARIHAKVEHPFRASKCQFGHRKVRNKSLAKNTAQLLMMFALSNQLALWRGLCRPSLICITREPTDRCRLTATGAIPANEA